MALASHKSHSPGPSCLPIQAACPSLQLPQRQRDLSVPGILTVNDLQDSWVEGILTTDSCLP